MLELWDVSKRYGDVAALASCTFRVRPGRLTGFVGPNGAGKTTAMRAIFGLIAPDAGTVSWCGHAVSVADRQRFGYMPEERGLYPRMRVADQLVFLGRLSGLSAAAATREADRWLDALGLGDRKKARLDDLSHGNQQRVQLAAALVHAPELLVLDEPFSGLDPIAMDSMSALLVDTRARRRGGVVLQPPARHRRAPVRGRHRHRFRHVVLTGRAGQDPCHGTRPLSRGHRCHRSAAATAFARDQRRRSRRRPGPAAGRARGRSMALLRNSTATWCG